MTFENGLFILLFTYAFMLARQLMSWQKHFTMKDFDWNKALIGIVNELGLVGFLGLVFLMPQYVNVELSGVDLSEVVNVALVLPLGNEIIKSFNKAKELRHIDVSEI